MKFIKLSAFALSIFLTGVVSAQNSFPTSGTAYVNTTAGATANPNLVSTGFAVTNAGGQELKLNAPAGQNTDFTLQQAGLSKGQIKYDPVLGGVGLYVDAAGTGQGVANLVLFAEGSGTTKAVAVGGSTTATGYTLSVLGKAIAEEVRVQLQASWPDYVFASDYDLMPLNELEANIKANKHLPGIPAAAEVEAGGFDLGEMNRLQMEKIEELTLYIIDLQKQIDSLKTK